MSKLRALGDGLLIGAMFGVVASALYVVLWWAMDILMAHVSPALVVAWSAVGCALIAGGLSVAGGDR